MPASPPSSPLPFPAALPLLWASRCCPCCPLKMSPARGYILQHGAPQASLVAWHGVAHSHRGQVASAGQLFPKRYKLHAFKRVLEHALWSSTNLLVRHITAASKETSRSLFSPRTQSKGEEREGRSELIRAPPALSSLAPRILVLMQFWAG